MAWTDIFFRFLSLLFFVYLLRFFRWLIKKLWKVFHYDD